jgi:hypothetical protein
MLQIQAEVAHMRLLSLVLLFFSIPAYGMSVSDVLDQMRRAMRVDRRAAVEQIEFIGALQLGGMTGRIDEISSTRDARRATHFDLSVVGGSSGYDGANVWSADAAGLVDVDESVAGKRKAITTSFIVNRLYLNPNTIREPTLRREEHHDVVTFTPESGELLELWIDAGTHLVTRSVIPASQEVTTWSDYREVSGLMLPFRIESNNSSNNPQTIVIETYRIAHQVEEARFVKPRSHATDTDITATPRTLSAHVEGGHVYVEASINDAPPALFILDTGASVNVLTPQAAKSLGVAARGNLNATGVGEAQVDVALATIPSVRVGPARLRNQLFAIIPLPSITATRDGIAQPIAGLLGYDFFRRMRVTIDYAGHRVTLAPLQACSERVPSAVPLYLDEGRIPRIPLTIAGVQGLWTLDVGDAGSLTVSAALAQQLAIPNDAGIASMREGGVGGVTRSRLLQLNELQIGMFELPDPIVEISEQKSGAFAEPNFAGNIGYGTLRQFVPTFDYECRTLELTPSPVFGTPAPYDRAGITWRRHDDGTFRVLHVLSGSPASAAGVRIDDVLIAIDDQTAASLTRAKINELQSATSGTRVRMQVRRGDQRLTLSMKLAEFVPKFRPSANASKSAPSPRAH